MTTFACQFGIYRYKCLPFGAALADDMFQRKIDETFKELPNMFGITGDIVVLAYDDGGRDHNNTVQKVLLICTNVNLK